MSDSSKQQTADGELGDFLAQLDAEFGKKVKQKNSPGAKELNRAFHTNNPQIGNATGKAPERLNVEDSAAWKPVARVTHVVRQGCQTCGSFCDFIGGEYVKFKSVHQFGGEVLRRTEHCPNLFLYRTEVELEDLIEWHAQTVTRCPGCIQVEHQAEQIWLSVQKAEVQPALPIEEADKAVEEIEIDLGEQ